MRPHQPQVILSASFLANSFLAESSTFGQVNWLEFRRIFFSWVVKHFSLRRESIFFICEDLLLSSKVIKIQVRTKQHSWTFHLNLESMKDKSFEWVQIASFSIPKELNCFVKPQSHKPQASWDSCKPLTCWLRRIISLWLS